MGLKMPAASLVMRYADAWTHLVHDNGRVMRELNQMNRQRDQLEKGRTEHQAEIDQESALVCQISGISPVTIDGAEGRQNDQLCFGRDHVIQVFVDHADRIYLIYWFSRSPIPETDRAIFAAALKRFTFAD